jgi:preprotein translocase subunit SecD
LLLSAGCSGGPPEHGTAFTLEAEVSGLQSDPEKQQALTATAKVLSERLARFGTRHGVEANGAQRLLVKVPSLPQPEMESLRRLISRQGLLELRLVHERSAELSAAGQTDPGYHSLELRQRRSDGREVSQTFLVSDRPELTGGIARAVVLHDNLGQPEIGFTLQPAASQQFARITRDNIGRQLAIVLDGHLYAAPIIQAPIEQGSAVISGHFDRRQALELAWVLEHPLPVQVKMLQEKPF